MCYLRQFCNQICFIFSFQIGRGFRDTPANPVRFCLQVESKGNFSSDNCLKGSLKHSVLLSEGFTPINSSVSPQKNVFYVQTDVSDRGLNYIHFIKTQVADTLLQSFIVFIYSYLEISCQKSSNHKPAQFTLTNSLILSFYL